MRYDAVIFDLFGTLVPNAGGGAYRESLRQTAEAVGADPNTFYDIWTRDDFIEKRFTGHFRSKGDSIASVCDEMGLAPSREQIASAARCRLDFERNLISSGDGAVDALKRLGEKGLKLALMSSCSADAPHLFRETALAPLFDELLFSFEVGLNKPDPRLYALACERLGVEPDRCLYVGDGAGKELTGARGAGMTAVLICRPGEEEIVSARAEARDWTGPRIAAADEVLELLAL